MRNKPSFPKILEPRGSKKPRKFYEAEQFTLPLGDNWADNLRKRLEHEARNELFTVTPTFIPRWQDMQPSQAEEQLELFHLFTGHTNTE